MKKGTNSLLFTKKELTVFCYKLKFCFCIDNTWSGYNDLNA